MSESKGAIVLKCCEAANCGIPDPDEKAFDYVYDCYMEGINYVRDGEDYPTRELIENLIPYNNFTVATIWTQLQLYTDSGNFQDNVDKQQSYIEQFQEMLFVVVSDFVIQGIEDAGE